MNKLLLTVTVLLGGLSALAPAQAARAQHLSAQSIPATPERGIYQRGYAVYYGGRADRVTRMTAAHLRLPFGTWVRVTSSQTGRSVVVKINDRGPFNGQGRIIDLSTTAARALGITRQGIAPVTIRILP